MDQIKIIGGNPLYGEIPIGGAKNAALPLMAASLLSAEPLELVHLPRLDDIATMSELLRGHGVEIDLDARVPQTNGGGETLALARLCTPTVSNTTAHYDIVRKMRASVLVLGPLLARVGQARVSLPGGCAIGTRPVNLHIDGLSAMGAEIDIADGYIEARAPKGLHGATIRFPLVSVGASENLLMAATLAHGETVLENAAREPEVGDLAHCLNAMGAKIEGIGTDRLVIQGVARLHGARHHVLPDRVEAATYAIAAAITGGEITLSGARLNLLETLVDVLERSGSTVVECPGGLRVKGNGRPKAVDIETQPFPGFATDMQAQMMALMSLCEGASVITENIFENRYMHVPELVRMGADITVHGATAVVRGVSGLKGAPVMATDLRASVCLVLAGLAAKGETLINRVYHLDRGYERLEEKLVMCGADIERLRGK